MKILKILKIVVGVLSAICVLNWNNEGLAIVIAGRMHITWPAKSNTKSYEIKIRGPKGKTALVETDLNSWTGDLPCGDYKVFIFAKDQDGTTKIWKKLTASAAIRPIDPIHPQDTASINASNGESHSISFTWEPADFFDWASRTSGELTYHVQVQSDDGLFSSTTASSEPKQTMEIPGARKFTWSVQPSAPTCSITESDKHSFELSGNKLARPTITIQESKYETDLSWEGPEATHYATELKARAFEFFWDSVELEKNTTRKHLKIDSTYESGVYRFNVKSKAALRTESDPDQVTFIHERLRRHQVDLIVGWLPFSRSYRASGSVLNVKDSDFTTYSGEAALIYKHHSGFGLYAEGQTSQRSQSFHDSVSGKNIGRTFRYNRLGAGLSQSVVAKFMEFNLKVGASRQYLTYLTTDRKQILLEGDTVTTLDLAIEPSLFYFYSLFKGEIFTRLHMKSSPQTVTGFRDFGAGLSAERRLLGRLSVGLSYRYEFIEYSLTDQRAIDYKEALPVHYYGVYLRWILI